MLSVRGLLALPVTMFGAVRAIDRMLKGRRVDIVYSNTLAILAPAVWAKIRRVPHLWHVHEIVLAPAAARRGYPWLLRLFADRIVCNSTLTRKWLVSEQPAIASKALVIWNGLGTRPARDEIAIGQLRGRIGFQTGERLVALAGRINGWKGQEILVKAAGLLWEKGIRNVRYLIIGSPPPGQEDYLERLQSAVELSPAAATISLMDFLPNVWVVWDACDLAVVPSTEPEPFGMVAIEAMAAGKPVIAAAHGGLLEIVEPGVTGLLVKPKDEGALADAMERLLGDTELCLNMGQAGQARQAQLFSLDSQVYATVRCMDELISQAD
jgi:glycosyltransferase involved in cell wall biosynthesis